MRQEVKAAQTNPQDMEKLRHMVGANKPSKCQGYRNHYAPSECDMPSMLRLEGLGLVRRGRPYDGGRHFYHATKAGCAAAGLGPVATRRATEEQ